MGVKDPANPTLRPHWGWVLTDDEKEELAADSTFSSTYVPQPEDAGTVGQVPVISSIDPLVMEWADSDASGPTLSGPNTWTGTQDFTGATVTGIASGGTLAAAESPLGEITKASTGPYRILMWGTSIANSPFSPNAVMTAALRAKYGDSGMVNVMMGLYGGTYTDPSSDGWKKQRYGGPMYTRARGDNASSAIVMTEVFDAVTIEFSRETDSEAASVLIDGVSVGSSPAAGAQALRQAQTFTAAGGIGVHTLTINPPAGAGFVYIERIEFTRSDRRGVEVIDGTLGGSTLNAMVGTVAGSGAQVTTIPTVGDNGIDAHCNRTDIDLFIVSHVVNDAGNSAAFTAYETNMNKVVAKTRALRRPLIIIVEPAGHFALPNDAGSSTNNTRFNSIRNYLLGLAETNNHVTVVDWHGATAMPDDLPGYAARYYPGVSALNVAAGTYTGDFIHPQGISRTIGVAALCNAVGIEPPAELGKGAVLDTLFTREAPQTPPITATVEGSLKRYTNPAGLALDNQLSNYYATVPYYRDPSATNAAAAFMATVDASVTSNEYGPYLDLSNSNVSLGSGWTAAPSRQVLLLVAATSESGSNVGVRVSSKYKLEVEGTALAYGPDSRSSYTKVLYDTEKPVALAFRVQNTTGDDTGNYFEVSGRVFGLYVTDSDVPLITVPESGGGAGGAVDVQLFASSGTWTKPEGAVSVRVVAVSGGGGGGSGRRGAAGTVRGGGGGGGGGGVSDAVYRAADLPSTVTVTVGAGGAGGAAITADDTNGVNGSHGGVSSFIGTGVSLTSSNGSRGNGGTTAGGAGGSAGSGNAGSSGGGGAGAATAGATVGTESYLRGATGGGGGGGLTAADAVTAASAGARNFTWSSTVTSVAGVNGVTTPLGTDATLGGTGGIGGGGGGAHASNAGQAGAAGGTYGAGGGGGSASVNGQASGAGGAGASGAVLVITSF